MAGKTKLELTWIGKESRPRLEPRILLEGSPKSYRECSEPTRNRKRAELYVEQDKVDERRNGMITDIERQLQSKHAISPILCVRWSVR